MNEFIFNLETRALTSFYGAENKHLNLIKKAFPKLKIIGRDQNLLLYGNEEHILLCIEKVQQILKYLDHYNSLTEKDVEEILDATEVKELNTDSSIILHGVSGKIIKPQNDTQTKMIAALQKNDMLFALGPAGTGKTYLAVALAVRALKNKEVRRIIITRPAVEAGENLGFLPGDLKDKLDPYLQPIYDALRDMIHHDKLKEMLEKGIIEIAPLAFMRGRTLDNAFVILDESQNTTVAQMKMFLTRMGRNAKFIITGDPEQVDLPSKQISGLIHAINLLNKIKEISLIHFSDKDVVRHKLVRKIIEAYRQE